MQNLNRVEIVQALSGNIAVGSGAVNCNLTVEWFSLGLSYGDLHGANSTITEIFTNIPFYFNPSA